MAKRYCAIMFRERRILKILKRYEWRWIIFKAKSDTEAISNAKKLVNDENWSIAFIGVEL